MFGRKQAADAAVRVTTTIAGRPQLAPESAGPFSRRFRMFIEAARRVEGHPLASADSIGRPLGDGHGLEEIVAIVAPLFATEPSLTRWVALRGAVAEVSIRVLESDAGAARAELQRVMGLDWVAGADGQLHPDLVLPWRAELTSEQREAAIGVASSVLIRAEDYSRYESMSVDDANNDPSVQRLSPAVSLDIIAWCAIALLRLDIEQQLFDQVPEPDQLSEPGWYAEPLFSKSERFWDGTDWTDRCRIPAGRGFTDTRVPLS